MTGDEPIRVPITDVFDLHSFQPRDCRMALEAWLEEAIAQGFTHVRIIHGRGIGKQREMVRQVLSGTAEVVHLEDAPPGAGGWGATVATLAKRRAKSG